MNISDRDMGFDLVNKIIKDSSFEIQNEAIRALFEQTCDDEYKDVMLRLKVIDATFGLCTRKSIFAFEGIAKSVVEFIENALDQDFHAYWFLNYNLDEIDCTREGIDKTGKWKGCDFGLLSRYLSYRTGGEFPIFTNIMHREMMYETTLLKKPVPRIEYFKRMEDVKKTYRVSYKQMNDYFWVCASVREANIAQFFRDKWEYRTMLRVLGFESEKCAGFEKKLIGKLKEADIEARYLKIKNIQQLYLALKW